MFFFLDPLLILNVYSKKLNNSLMKKETHFEIRQGQAGYTLSHGESGNLQCISKTCMETHLCTSQRTVKQFHNLTIVHQEKESDFKAFER